MSDLGSEILKLCSSACNANAFSCKRPFSSLKLSHRFIRFYTSCNTPVTPVSDLTVDIYLRDIVPCPRKLILGRRIYEIGTTVRSSFTRERVEK